MLSRAPPERTRCGGRSSSGSLLANPYPDAESLSPEACRQPARSPPRLRQCNAATKQRPGAALMLEHRPGGKLLRVRSASQSYGYSFKAELQFTHRTHDESCARVRRKRYPLVRALRCLRRSLPTPRHTPHAWPLDRPFDVVANTERIPCNVASPACSRSAAFRVFPLSAAVSAGHVRVPLRDVSERVVTVCRGLGGCHSVCQGAATDAAALAVARTPWDWSRVVYVPFAPSDVSRVVPRQYSCQYFSSALQNLNSSSAAPAVSRPHSSHL